MQDEAYLGVDVGLSGLRAAWVDGSGVVLGQVREVADCDRLTAAELVAGVERVIGRLRSSDTARSVASVSVCAFGPAPVLLDATGQVVLRVAMRPDGISPQAKGDDLACRIAAVRQARPADWRRAATCCDVTGYLAAHLTGRVVIDTASAADFEAAEIGPSLPLPPSLAAEAICGGLDAAVAARLNLPSGTPVAVGCYDSSADLLAAGFGPARPSCMVLGTTLVLGRLTAEPIADPTLRSMQYPGIGWFSGGWTNCAGEALDLARRWLGAADASASNDGTPLVLPYFTGERAPVWDAGATGAILGLTAGMSASDLHRGFAEGVALSALDLADRLASEIGPVAKWFAIGGGTKAPGLMQALADALDAEIEMPDPTMAGVGPAYLAARAVGVDLVLPSVSALRSRPAESRRLRRRLSIYRAAQGALSQINQALRADFGNLGEPA